MSDSFEVELRRVVRALRDRPAVSADAMRALSQLLDALMEADSRARGITHRSESCPPRVHASMVQSVAFDAADAGVDLEVFIPALVDARRALASSG